MSSKRVLYWPYVRETIQIKFNSLLDAEFRKTWLEKAGGNGIAASLNYYVFEYLYDTPWASLWNESYKAIDVTLYNEEEADIISDFLNFDRNNFEAGMPDKYYINHPKWPDLLEKARVILDTMEDNSKKYNLAADLKSWDEDYEDDNLPTPEEGKIMDEKTDERLRQHQEKQGSFISSN